MDINIKRIYEPYSAEDGYRILVDRLWPRGVAKADARIDYWAKEVAPTNELRTWFGHEKEKFQEFYRKYEHELSENSAAVEELLTHMAGHSTVTFLYGAKDEEHNQAQVLRTYCKQKLK